MFSIMTPTLSRRRTRISTTSRTKKPNFTDRIKGLDMSQLELELDIARNDPAKRKIMQTRAKQLQNEIDRRSN